MNDQYASITSKDIAERIMKMTRRAITITATHPLPLYVQYQGREYRADPIGGAPIDGPYEYMLTPKVRFDWDAG